VNRVVGWTLVTAALVAGWFSWGWQGLVLAVTVIVFWLLLQFSRTLRVMKKAAERPLGSVASAITLQSKLAAGMNLLQVIQLTGSLGRRVSEQPEVFAWQDAGGDAVHVTLADGKVSGWSLVRA